MNTKRNISDEAADMRCKQATWDWFYDDWGGYAPPSVPFTQVMVNAVIKGAPVPWAPHVILLLQNQMIH